MIGSQIYKLKMKKHNATSSNTTINKIILGSERKNKNGEMF